MQRGLKAARLRRRRALQDAGQAAWIGAHGNADTLRNWLDGLDDGPRRRADPQTLGRALQNMAANLPMISMDEYRRRVKGQR